MRAERESRLALVLAFALTIFLSGSLTGAQGADRLPGEQRVLTSKSRAALLSLYALDSRLAQARTELARLRTRADTLAREEREVRAEVAIVQRNLHVSQQVLGTHLRTLYEEGEPDAIAVLLAARSLEDAVTRLNELEQSAHQSAQAVSASQTGRERLRRLAARLAARARAARALAARAEQTTRALEAARAERLAYLASLAAQRRLKARQIKVLETRSRRSVQQASTIQPAAPATGRAVVAGARVLTVTATGYSLPGKTATGLPVGPGVAAVDPAVIPLGTRMTVPGYGEAVAADTGSAVSGYAIDLWFPTLADALAWGRRTVTITLH